MFDFAQTEEIEKVNQKIRETTQIIDMEGDEWQLIQLFLLFKNEKKNGQII